MGYLAEKYNYVKGLCDGLQIDTEVKEGKLLMAIMELLDEMILSVEDLEESRDEIYEFMDEVDEDLAEVEEIIYGEEYDEDDCVIGEIECPECNALVEITADMIEGDKFVCPACESEIEIDCECDCENCDECDG